MKVSDNIAFLRRCKDLTQKELSDRTGINQSVLSRIENGTRPVRDDELKIFADFFNVSADYLLGRDSKFGSLTKRQSALLGMFDGLNDEGQNTLMNVLGSLKVSHSKLNSSPSIVQKNSGGTNFLAAGGNNNYRIVSS